MPPPDENDREMDKARAEVEQVERAQTEAVHTVPADSTAVEPKHKRLGKTKAPLPSFLPDYVEPETAPSGMVEAIRDEVEKAAATPVIARKPRWSALRAAGRPQCKGGAATRRQTSSSWRRSSAHAPPKGSHHRPRSMGNNHQPTGARSAADTLRTGASILAHVPRFERDLSRLNRLRASPVASC